MKGKTIFMPLAYPDKREQEIKPQLKEYFHLPKRFSLLFGFAGGPHKDWLKAISMAREKAVIILAAPNEWHRDMLLQGAFIQPEQESALRGDAKRLGKEVRLIVDFLSMDELRAVVDAASEVLVAYREFGKYDDSASFALAKALEKPIRVSAPLLPLTRTRRDFRARTSLLKPKRRQRQ